MRYEDEKDYIMRIIKETATLLFSLLFRKPYVSVEQELENKYEISGKGLDDLLKMTDDGDINEAENLVLSGINYNDKKEVAAAALFYHYLSEKDEDFLTANNYSIEEVLDGMKEIMQKAGYSDLFDFPD